ncbi:MAG: TRAP transporter substrate-binding protein DctP [Methylobacterium sp.]|nr:TRAP transporter substrate-binding protein DctP [Methylobacterium sp.]
MRKIAALAGAAMLSAAWMGTSPAFAQSGPTVRFGHMNSPTHIVHRGAERMRAALEQAGVRMELFPSAQLGENSAVLEQLTLGANIITQVGPGTIAQYAPNYSVLVYPFLYNNFEEVKRLIESPLVKSWEPGLARNNIKLLCAFNFGTRDLYTRNRPVRTPADAAGLKVRVQPVAIYTELVRSMGGQPTPMPWPEVYSALSQGVIDAAEAPPNALLDQKHTEAARFYMQTNHILDASVIVMSLRAFNALPAPQQQSLQKAANEMCDWMTGEATRSYGESVAEIERRGMTIVRDVDRAAFARNAEGIAAAFPNWTPNLVGEVRKALGR